MTPRTFLIPHSFVQSVILLLMVALSTSQERTARVIFRTVPVEGLIVFMYRKADTEPLVQNLCRQGSCKPVSVHQYRHSPLGGRHQGGSRT